MLDWVEPLLQTESATGTLDRSEAGVLVPKAKKQLQNIKSQLDTCEDYRTAVLISRVVRAIQKSLKERINSPLTEIDFTVPQGTTGGKAKIEMLQDTLEYSFPVCNKLLTKMRDEVNDNSTTDADAMLNVDLLAKVSKVRKYSESLENQYTAIVNTYIS